jgi:aryl-alcohol dehydrogenase-like predicted oxidoreductase
MTDAEPGAADYPSMPMTMTTMTLPTRPLGSTGLNITAVGFGAWAVGGGGWAFGWGPQDDEQSINAMRHATELGINWIDTAAVYGLGHSEVLVGRLLRTMPANDRPLVFTKCGLVWDERNPMAPPRRTLRPASIRKECEASLGRLGIERIDLYQFHWPAEDGTPIEDSWDEMGRLIDEGKVRFGGVSNFDIPLLERCEARRHVSSEQSLLSLIHRDTAADVVPWCEAHHTGFLAYSPMQSGLLTDAFSAEKVSKLAPDDWRRRDADFQPPRLQQNLALRDALRPIAARHTTSVAAVSVAWVLAWRGVSGAIAGARSPEQVDGWIAAASLNLTTEDLDEIAEAIKRTGAGSGPARP